MTPLSFILSVIFLAQFASLFWAASEVVKNLGAWRNWQTRRAIAEVVKAFRLRCGSLNFTSGTLAGSNPAAPNPFAVN